MSVASLVISHVSVAYVLVHVVWEAGADVVLVLDGEGVQVMADGVIVRATVLVGEGLHLVVAYRLAEVVATAGHLHIAVLDVIHHMVTESKKEPKQGWNEIAEW